MIASASAIAAPELDTGSLYDYLAPPQVTLTKRVRNLGDVTAFVKVEVAEIFYNSQNAPLEQPLEGIDRALIASPSRLIIPAGSSREVRVVYRGPRLTERYFRVRFVPVIPELTEAFGMSEKDREQYRQAIAASVGVLKAIGGVVLVSPDPERFKTKVTHTGNQLQVANQGNTTVVLEDFVACQVQADCGQGRTLHVRPGTVFTDTAGTDQRFGFTLKEGKQRRRYAP